MQRATVTFVNVDLGVLYGEARLRIVQLVEQVGSAAIDDVPVPATPGWSVHDVIAHLSGIADDGTSGNMHGAPGEAWTAAQVARGASRTIDEMLERWSQTGPMLEAFLSTAAGGLAEPAVLDVHTHEADLRHALGEGRADLTVFLPWARNRLATTLADTVADAGLPPVTVDASDWEWFRGRFGRRTAAEVSALRWSSFADPYLDAWFIFGRAAVSLGEC